MLKLRTHNNTCEVQLLKSLPYSYAQIQPPGKPQTQLVNTRPQYNNGTPTPDTARPVSTLTAPSNLDTN